MAINTKPFVLLTVDAVHRLPGHMGVFELASSGGEILFIGFAGGRSMFGLRGEVLAGLPATEATRFRVEVTTAYLTRYQELLMLHVARFGDLPVENDPALMSLLGRLSPTMISELTSK